jgi:hypothetical protein
MFGEEERSKMTFSNYESPALPLSYSGTIYCPITLCAESGAASNSGFLP